MLRVIGKLRYIESRPYDFVDRETQERVVGVTHTAVVEQGRGRSESIKIREEHLSAVPADASIPDEGVDVDWDVEVARGKVQLYAPHVDRAAGRPPLTAAKAN